MLNLIDEIGPAITSLEFVRSQLKMNRPVTVKELLSSTASRSSSTSP